MFGDSAVFLSEFLGEVSSGLAGVVTWIRPEGAFSGGVCYEKPDDGQDDDGDDRDDDGWVELIFHGCRWGCPAPPWGAWPDREGLGSLVVGLLWQASDL